MNGDEKQHPISGMGKFGTANGQTKDSFIAWSSLIRMNCYAMHSFKLQSNRKYKEALEQLKKIHYYNPIRPRLTQIVSRLNAKLRWDYS